MNVIDLFSGAGGLSEGFARSSFHTAIFFEKEIWACQTLETRLCYHWLLKRGDISLYHQYCMQAGDYHNIIGARNEIIYSKYPELKEYARNAIINQVFGNSSDDPNALDGKSAIALIEERLKAQHIEKIDVVVGGPPCQAYSIIGRSRMGESVKDDSRNYLFRYYLEIVEKYQPSLFVFENVPGLLSAQDGRIYNEIRAEFKEAGYTLLCGKNGKRETTHRVCDYGVNQKRRRLILIGYRDLEWPNPEYPEFSKYATCFNEPQTTQNTIGDLPPLEAGTGSDSWYLPYSDTDLKLSAYEKEMRKNSAGVQNHFARYNREDDLQIYAHARELALQKQTLSYSSLPDNLKHHKNADTRQFDDRFRVHSWDGMPHTIVAHISKDGHYNIHPIQNRSITVREAARIQSFPDDYRFEGPRTAQFRQVGNAVPPLFAQAIAAAVMDMLKPEGRKGNA